MWRMTGPSLQAKALEGCQQPLKLAEKPEQVPSQPPKEPTLWTPWVQTSGSWSVRKHISLTCKGSSRSPVHPGSLSSWDPLHCWPFIFRPAELQRRGVLVMFYILNPVIILHVLQGRNVQIIERVSKGARILTLKTGSQASSLYWVAGQMVKSLLLNDLLGVNLRKFLC